MSTKHWNISLVASGWISFPKTMFIRKAEGETE